MNDIVIHDKKGRLTAFGLAAGFIERKRIGSVSVTMWREHDCYHVRAHNHATGQRIFWSGYRALNAARRHYAKANPVALVMVASATAA